MPRLDPHSCNDSDQPETDSLEWRARIDFSTRRLDAEVLLRLRAPGEGPFDLDTRDLEILAVTDGSGRALEHVLGTPDAVLGARLRVMLPAGTEAVRVAYRTRPQAQAGTTAATALQWLAPAQTAGAQPYLFSQCQAIHARSVVPLQDTPRLRVRYRAELRFPSQLQAVMAAAFVSRVEHGDEAVATFAMEQPIPPYLLALAVGDLVFRDLGPRSRVWAEPALIDRAAHEFSGVDEMLRAAEALFGPYPWGRFDLLTMPPSFPYGGMENPTLTFLTPTLLAGDRSLVNVVAHELAHSWTGNLVTNASAEHFWLNEGFTVYAERRILERIAGDDVALLHAALGRRELQRALDDFKDRPELTRLRTHLAGVHPDDAFSGVPYEKGCLFLCAIELAVGRARFDRFLVEYLDRFRFRSLTSEDFVAFLDERLPEARARVDLHGWIDEPGLPAGSESPDSTGEGSARLRALEALPPHVPTEDEARAFSPVEWHLYLALLPQPAPASTCELLDARFHLTESRNYEILVAWLTLAAASDYAPAFPRIDQVLAEVGRMKYLKPLYLALARRPESRDHAGLVFRRCRDRYHPIARQAIEAILRRHNVTTHEVNTLGIGAGGLLGKGRATDTKPG